MLNFSLIILILLQAIIQATILDDKSHCLQDGIADTELSFALDQMNKELFSLRKVEANVKWDLATKSSVNAFKLNSVFSESQNDWRKQWCSNLRNLREIHLCFYERMIHFLCRGPIYTPAISKELSLINNELSLAYESTKICKINKAENQCFHAEPDLENYMATTRNVTELLWMWKSWQNEMSRLKILFGESVILQNLGARNNNYSDIGEYLREEFEVPELEKLVMRLYNEIAPLYKLLHAFVRYKLVEINPKILHPKRPIFSHLLGNLWSQNWSPLLNLLLPNAQVVNITDRMLEKNYTVREMVKKAEDFYFSLGFPELPEAFWRMSSLEKKNKTRNNCHAAAANMYSDDDFRILACLQINVEDFQVIFHEMGHVQYFMAYADQPTIFKSAPNSAFHEAIGETVFLGAMAPQNLLRLGLVNDSLLTDNLPILLKLALSKLPLLAHSLVMDVWRWQVFSGQIKPSHYNRSWWKLYKKYMGIEPPTRRSEIHFDPTAVFHIAENIPSIRYFLSTILQFQLFESMCQVSVDGKIDRLNFNIPLHQCDIYGSKEAGRRLRSLMQQGSSINWKNALYQVTESTNYDTKFFLNYFEPLRDWLQLQITRHNIPIGWD